MALPELLTIVAMLALNAVFASFELALASSSPAQLQLALEAGRRGARAAVAMRGSMEASLAVVQVGITMAGAVAAATGGASVDDVLAPWLERSLGVGEAWAEVLALTLFVLPLAYLTIVLGELVPKVLALRDPVRVCLRFAPVMHALASLARPAVALLSSSAGFLARRLGGAGVGAGPLGLAELRAQIRFLGSARQIGHEEERLLLAASHFSRLPVQAISVPADAMATLSLDATPEECMASALAELHTRFPVTRRRGDLGEVVGYATFKELALMARRPSMPPSIAGIVRPLPSFPASMLLGDAVRRLVADRRHLALLRGEDGSVTGLMTLEDAFEELVGEIEDEFDLLPAGIEPEGASWSVGGGTPVARVREAVGDPAFAPTAAPTATLDAWVRTAKGRRPRGGDEVDAGAWTVSVRRVRRHRVMDAALRRRGSPRPPVPPGEGTVR